ncbi:MAG: cupin domain-containing protein [Kingella oralis]
MNTQNSEQQVKHGIFPFGEKNERYADVFVGQSYLAGLAAAPDASATVAHVSFEPACRNNWHIHTDGYQILLVTGGEGWYQEHGSPARSLQAGDVVVTNKGVKHWHGAKKDCWFSHIAITAGNTEFLEPVDEVHYNALPD